MTYALFDSHCHLDFPEFDQDRDEVLASCLQQGVRYICIPATHYEQWGRVMSVKQHNMKPLCYVALGLHPCFIDQHRPSHLEALRQRCSQVDHGLVAIGEIGLDFSTPEWLAQKERQITFFEAQLDIAKKLSITCHYTCTKSA